MDKMEVRKLEDAKLVAELIGIEPVCVRVSTYGSVHMWMAKDGEYGFIKDSLIEYVCCPGLAEYVIAKTGAYLPERSTGNWFINGYGEWQLNLR